MIAEVVMFQMSIFKIVSVKSRSDYASADWKS